MHEHQTNWEIYCHLEIYMEAAQTIAGIVQETHLLELRLHVNGLFFSHISPETSFFCLSSGKLFPNGLNSAIWPALKTQANQKALIIDNYSSLILWDVFTSTNYNSHLLRLCSPAALTEAKLVQLDSNDVFASGLEKQTSPKSFLVIFFCLSSCKKCKTIPLCGFGWLR